MLVLLKFFLVGSAAPSKWELMPKECKRKEKIAVKLTTTPLENPKT